MTLATSENNTQNSLSELIHLQIQYLKEHNAYELFVVNLLNPNINKYYTCTSILDIFNWDQTSEGRDFWYRIQTQLRIYDAYLPVIVSYSEVFKIIFPVDLYPHLYI